MAVSVHATSDGIISAAAICCANWQTAVERVWQRRLALKQRWQEMLSCCFLIMASPTRAWYNFACGMFLYVLTNNCLSNAMHGQNINLPVCVSVANAVVNERTKLLLLLTDVIHYLVTSVAYRRTHLLRRHCNCQSHTGTPPAADWKRPPGRPRKNWLQQVEEDIGLSVGAAWIAGQDRSMWRTLRPSAGQPQQWVSEWVCVCVRHTFCQLDYRSDPSTDFYSW